MEGNIKIVHFRSMKVGVVPKGGVTDMCDKTFSWCQWRAEQSVALITQTLVGGPS